MPVRRLGLLLLLTSSTFAPAAEDAMPSMDFLEFLGEWGNEDGDWIDAQIQTTPDGQQSQREVHDDD